MELVKELDKARVELQETISKLRSEFEWFLKQQDKVVEEKKQRVIDAENKARKNHDDRVQEIIAQADEIISNVVNEKEV